MQPLISIIIPIYNDEKYVHECIDSVINQTYENLEIILVDDGSIDNSGKICDEYVKKDERIVVIHKQNGGTSKARNTGIDIATGEYLHFVDSDDWIEEDMIEVLYKNLIDYDADISTVGFSRYSGYKETKEQEEPVNHFKAEDEGRTVHVFTREEALLSLLKYESHIDGMPVAKLYKSHIFESLRYPIGMRCEDAYIAVKLLLPIKKIVVSDIPKYYYRRKEGSYTEETGNIAALLIECYESYRPDITENFPHLISLYEKFLFERYQWVAFTVATNKIYRKKVEMKSYKNAKRYIKKNLNKYLNNENVNIGQKEIVWLWLFKINVIAFQLIMFLKD